MNRASAQSLDGFEDVLLPEVCPVPDPTHSDVAYERFYHLDLDDMTRSQLLQERTRMVIGIAHQRAPHPWLEERLAEVHRRVCRGR